VASATNPKPGSSENELHTYWTKDPRGLAKWATTAHPYTNLVQHLTKFIGKERAQRVAAQWFRDVFGVWPGERAGKNPAGPG
jgi:hypothetical protein